VADQAPGTAYRTPRSFRVFYTTLFILFTVLVLTFAIWTAFDRESQQGPPLWFFGILIVVLAWNWYWYLRMAYEIRIQDDSTVEFHSMLRRISIPLRSIRMVELRFLLNPHEVTILYGQGKVHVLFPIQGLYKFLAWLEDANPAVEIKNL
jgi:hypothetical protein